MRLRVHLVFDVDVPDSATLSAVEDIRHYLQIQLERRSDVRDVRDVKFSSTRVPS